jgi:hypothetical protein
MEAQWYWPTVAYVYGRCGRPAEARQALYELNKIGAHTRIDPAVFLFAYAGTGAKEQLLATLDAATPSTQALSPLSKWHRPTRQCVTSPVSRTSSGDWVCDPIPHRHHEAGERPQLVRLITPSGRLRRIDITPDGRYYAATTATSPQSSWLNTSDRPSVDAANADSPRFGTKAALSDWCESLPTKQSTIGRSPDIRLQR